METPAIYKNPNSGYGINVVTGERIGPPEDIPKKVEVNPDAFPDFEPTKDAFKLQHGWVIKSLVVCLNDPSLATAQRREILLDIRESLSLLYGKTAIRYETRKRKEPEPEDDSLGLTDEQERELAKLDVAQAKEQRSGKREPKPDR